MKVIPRSLSKVSSLEVLLLDGCLGLEYVGALPPSLNSFSLDGYGAASIGHHLLIIYYLLKIYVQLL
jgi:hypothetical protein